MRLNQKSTVYEVTVKGLYMWLQSVSPQHSQFHTVQTCELGSPTLEWGCHETWYAPETWLVCFQLATTTNIGGKDLTVPGDRDKTLARWKQACDF